ncbi:SUKH-4 family immunity protein [Kitasatospora sp. NBC_01539]|uniref:SUKH-4 family immunity protein n=1 Tax=Kitasatospora sp. NBC_01539 TaxID=2903577 RepID=UPI0038602E3D
MTTGPEPTHPDRPFDPADLPVLIEDPVFLAEVGRAGLLAGMAAVWPDGVPRGTLAEDIHHLDRLGVRPGPGQHPEWLAWLHLLLVSHGRDADAAALLAAAPRLPWRTVWSRWVPPGARAGRPAPGGQVVGLRAVERDGEPLLAVHEAFVLARLEREEPDDEEGYEEYALAPGTGRVVAGPKLYRPYAHDEYPRPYVPVVAADLPEAGSPARNTPEGWQGAGAAGLPACHEQVTHAVRLDRLAVLGGGWGCYAVETAEDPAPAGPAAWPMPAEDTLTTALAPAALPAAAAAPDHTWLAACFGEQHLWKPAPETLPAGLEHAPTRDFLTGPGFPAFHSALLQLGSEHLRTEGAAELRNAELYASDDPEAREHGTHSYVLARDGLSMFAVDGSTGRVTLYDPERWEGDYDYGVVASSAERFAALLRLYTTYYYGTGPEELADAGRLLRDWAQELDPVTASSLFWQEIFQDREDFV